MGKADWPLIISAFAIVISIIAVAISYGQYKLTEEQNKLTETLNHLSIDPKIATHFYYPNFNNSNSGPITPVGKAGTLNIAELNSSSESPWIVIENDGLISIAYLGVKHELFSFDKMINNITNIMISTDPASDIGGNYFIFENILDPKEKVSLPLARYSDKRDKYNKTYAISAYVFDLDYYRPLDLKHYSKRVIYFCDNGTVYKDIDFTNNSYYQSIMNCMCHRLSPPFLSEVPSAHMGIKCLTHANFK